MRPGPVPGMVRFPIRVTGLAPTGRPNSPQRCLGQSRGNDAPPHLSLVASTLPPRTHYVGPLRGWIDWLRRPDSNRRFSWV